MTLALVHDYLIQMGGAERVVECMARAHPAAPIHTSATLDQGLFPVFRERRIHNSWMQGIPGLGKIHKKLFFLYPFAFASMRRPRASMVWVSSSGFAKWIRYRKGSRVYCYCHTPPRFFWQPDLYLEREIERAWLRAFVKRLVPLFRESDYRQAQRVHRFIANSRNVQARIREYYGRDSIVIYPPVNLDRFALGGPPGDHYLIVSRLVGYKRVDLAVRAFTGMKKRLVIVGDGPDRANLESIAGPTVEFRGRIPDDEVVALMRGCRGFIFPGMEDFGITPVEAQACGKPVIAFGEGGALETVVEGETGIFFRETRPEALAEAVRRAESVSWDPERIRRNAERFSEERFLREMSRLMQEPDL